MDFTTSVEDKLIRKSRMELKELEAQEEQDSGLVPRSCIQLSLRGDSKHPRTWGNLGYMIIILSFVSGPGRGIFMS